MDEASLRQPLVYSIPGMDEMEVRRDLTYRATEQTELTMDVYLPSGGSSGARFPAVLFVHGGPLPTDLPLLSKDWGVYVSYGKLAAASDLAGVTFNHRFSSRSNFDDPAADLAAAIAFVRDNAASLRVDPDRLCVRGFSGGGPLLSFVLRDRPAFVRCLVAYYAVLDLRHLGECSELEGETARAFSPAAPLGKERPWDLPIFVARAGLDRPGINESTDGFVCQALAANACLELANHPRGRHAFDIPDNDDRTREIIAATVRFVRTHLARRAETEE